MLLFVLFIRRTIVWKVSTENPLWNNLNYGANVLFSEALFTNDAIICIKMTKTEKLKGQKREGQIGQ